MKSFRIIFLFFALTLFVFSCTAKVREIKMPKEQYQIVVETKGKDMDETMAMFHDKAKSLCPDYEVININTDVKFDWGLFIWTSVPLNKRTVTGTITCKQPIPSEAKPSPDKVDQPTKPQVIPPEKPMKSTPPSDKNIVTVTWTFANIRSGAGNNYPVVANVKQGDKLTLIGELGDWLNVRLEDGKEGWISNRVVK